MVLPKNYSVKDIVELHQKTAYKTEQHRDQFMERVTLLRKTLTLLKNQAKAHKNKAALLQMEAGEITNGTSRPLLPTISVRRTSSSAASASTVPMNP